MPTINKSQAGGMVDPGNADIAKAKAVAYGGMMQGPGEINPYPLGSDAAKTWMPSGSMASSLYQGAAAWREPNAPLDPVFNWVRQLVSDVAAPAKTAASAAALPAAAPAPSILQRLGFAPAPPPVVTQLAGVRG